MGHHWHWLATWLFHWFVKSLCSGWHKCMIFRKSSSHALCFTCGKLRHEIACAETLDQHIASCSTYLSHLRDQFADRDIYWRLRARARGEKDVLSLIADGMDHSKFALPQWAGGRMPKHTVTDKCNRPCCSVYAVIAHGWRIDVYIASEGIPGGSSFSCDCILRTLDGVWRQCQQEGKSFPLDLAVQGDNTTKEIKNGICGRLFALMSLAGIFRATAHMHLRVGHTHEDVDAFFGLVARCRCACKSWFSSMF
jgi:hypothetical protein